MNGWSFAMYLPQVGQKGFVCENYEGYSSRTKEVGILAVYCWLYPG